jgi:hypothetical protein
MQQEQERLNRLNRRNLTRIADEMNVAQVNQDGAPDAGLAPGPPAAAAQLNAGAPPDAAVQENQNAAFRHQFQNNVPVNHRPPLPVEVWKTAPDRGNFNPGTKHGQLIFNEKSKGLPEDKRLDLNRTNGPNIHKVLRAREPHFRGVTEIPIEIDLFGNVRESGNILIQHQKITLSNCQRAGHVLFQDGFSLQDDVPPPPFTATVLDPANTPGHKAKFYEVVNNNVAVKIIQNTLTVNGYDDLLALKELFTYTNANGDTEYHAATMLHIMYENMDPTTEVGMDSILKKMESMKMSDFSNNVDDMLKSMERNYKVLYDNKQAPKNYRRLVLDALVTGPNNMFNEYIQRLTDDVESGTGYNANIAADEVIKGARSKYNNMSLRKQWNRVDPRDAELMALKTKVTLLEKKRAEPATVLTTTGNRTKKGKSPNDSELDCSKVEDTRMEKWRTIKKGATIEAQGRTHHWCENHSLPGKWDGLYMWHKPSECPKVARAAAASQKKSESGKSEETNTAAGGLQLNNNLKTVLMSNLCLSAEDVDKLLSEASAQEN